MDKSGHIDKTTCAASHRLGLDCNGIKFPKYQAFHDKLGFYWCVEHSARGRLLSWAEEHDYAPLAFYGESGRQYAIGCNDVRPETKKSMWMMAVVCGNDEAIAAADRHISMIVEEDNEGVI